MSSKICAVVVTYNRKELLYECILALMRQNLKVDILVVDNASTDGTKAKLRVWIEEGKIRYYNTGSNLGGAGGFHYGIKKAMAGSYEYLWLMDDDTIADKSAAKKLLQAAALLEDQFGFLCSTVYFNDGATCEMNRPGISDHWYDLDRYQYIKKGLVSVRNASFVSLLVRTEVVRKVGLPLKEFFIWFDDVEYTTRIDKQYNNYLVCDSRVTHKMEKNQTSNLVTEPDERIWRYFYTYRNRFYVAKRDGGEAIAIYFLSILNVLRKVIFGKTDHKAKKCLIVLKGVAAGFLFHPKVEYVRARKNAKGRNRKHI